MGKQLYDNEYTSDCIFLAAGGVINSVSAVLSNSVDFAFANVRPPGHHACFSSIGGFCYVNNVAIAAKYAQQYLGVKKIAIFDWDVHHGNGTQDIFKNDSSILYISTHRYDNAAFYPYLKESSAMFIGQGEGTGFNLNIAWDTEDPGNVSEISDGDYKLAFDSVISPVIDQFNPELVLVSAGYDAMKDDPVGKMSLSPNIFAYMTYMLKKRHKLVLALEGGYNINNLEEGAYASVRALLRSSVDFSSYNPEPTQMGKDSLSNTLEVNKEYWNIENYDLI